MLAVHPLAYVVIRTYRDEQINVIGDVVGLQNNRTAVVVRPIDVCAIPKFV